MSTTSMEAKPIAGNGLATAKGKTESSLPETLIDMAARVLPTMFDQDQALFSYRACRSDEGITNIGVSLRYTIISLLGLNRLNSKGRAVGIDLEAAMASLIEHAATIDNVGDVGLLLWLCASFHPEMLPQILTKLSLQGGLLRYPDVRQGRTMELSWLLAGLSHIALSGKTDFPDLEKLATATYTALLGNYRGKGVFSHMSGSSLVGIIRGRIGTFADQVYPIYALAKFSQAWGSRQALDISVACVETICRHQGELGQWWWHYDAATGRVAGRYPVFSVHQHGMAPMALLAAGAAAQQDFSAQINKGLHWLTGANEVGFQMLDPSYQVVWRSLYLPKYQQYCHDAGTMLGFLPTAHPKLRVRYECRSYCFGWLLYALC